MEEYIVSARKYRPMSFDSVVGQTALTTTLKNAVKTGKIAHAYLFCGPRGVGKTTCARILAKAINCMNPTADGEACNECESCKSFNEGRSLNIFELDAASNNGVEQIKNLMEQTRIPPQMGKYKVFIIDEVHMLTKDAFNAFLKTLEEPPAHVIFILATTEKNKVLPTILSRCQIYDFERMTVPNIIKQLKMVADNEHITYEEPALEVIAEKADGGMRDALSIFDQAASFCQGNITYEKVIEDLNVLDSDNYFKIINLALENKVSDIMVLLNSLISKGFDGGNIILGLAKHVRNLMMAKDSSTLPLLEVSERQKVQYQEQAKQCPTKFLYKALKIMNQCDVNYRQSRNKRLLVELTLIEIAQLTQPDDDSAGAGRSPKRLKSLFHKKSVSPKKVATQVATGDVSMPQTKVQGVEKATHAPSPAPSSGQSIKIGSLNLTFKDILSEDKKKKEKDLQPTDTVPTASDKFTQDDLAFQWMAMCKRMPPDMTGIASRMKNMNPVITDYPTIEVKVENQFLLEQMNSIKSRIRKTLAITLNNSEIDLKITLANPNEIKKIPSKKEMFDNLCQNNSAFKKLKDGLSLQLD